MLLIDDLAMLVLEGVSDAAEKEYASYLETELKRVTSLYERGKISERDYQRLKGQLGDSIKMFAARSKTGKQRYIDMSL